MAGPISQPTSLLWLVMTDSLTVTTGTLPPVLPVAQHTAAAAAQLVIKSSESTKTVN